MCSVQTSLKSVASFIASAWVCRVPKLFATHNVSRKKSQTIWKTDTSGMISCPFLKAPHACFPFRRITCTNVLPIGLGFVPHVLEAQLLGAQRAGSIIARRHPSFNLFFAPPTRPHVFSVTVVGGYATFMMQSASFTASLLDKGWPFQLKI